MRNITKHRLTKEGKIRLPKDALFVSLKIKNEAQLYFIPFGESRIERTFKLFQTSKEIASVSKKQYLGSCKVNNKNVYLFEIL